MEKAHGGQVGYPRVLGPLWVISLFLGVSEIAVTVATTQATGWIQAMLAIFAVVFPTVVSVVFFLILWNNNKVLYAPRDFAEGTTVHDFVEAMSRSTRRSVNVVDATLQSLSARLEAQLEAMGATDSQRSEIIESVSSAARKTVITVDVSRFAADREAIAVPVNELSTVTDLLDAVYFYIVDKVENFSYGKTWLLCDERTGQVFSEMGSPYALRELRTRRDFRSLHDVGIGPGAMLAMIPTQDTDR